MADLSSVKAGDELVWCSSGYRPRFALVTVEKVTKTQIVDSSGMRFRRDTGSGVGKNTSRLMAATPSNLATLAMFEAVTRFEKCVFAMSEFGRRHEVRRAPLDAINRASSLIEEALDVLRQDND